MNYEPTVLDLFSGVGGFSIAFEREGFKTIGFSEIDPYASAVLRKHWPDVPNYGDIKSLIQTITGIPSDQYIEKYGILKRSKIQRGSASISGIKVDTKSGKPFPNNTASDVEDFKAEGCRTVTTATLWDGQSFLSRDKGGGPSAEHIGESDRKGASGEEGKLRAVQSIRENEKRSIISAGAPSRLQQTVGSDVAMSEMPSRLAQGKQSERSVICDVITAGTPCQPASLAGKRRGKNDDRWLWPETFAVIHAVHPTWCLLENVPGFLSLESGLEFECVCAELESYGYSVQAFVIPACAVDARHRRDRVWIVAHSQGKRCSEARNKQSTAPDKARLSGNVADSEKRQDHGRNGGGVDKAQPGRQGEHAAVSPCGEDVANAASTSANRHTIRTQQAHFMPRDCRADDSNSRCQLLERGSGESTERSTQWEPQCRLGGVVNGVSIWIHEPAGIPRVIKGQENRVQRLKALGNSIVPQVAQVFAKAIRRFYP